ncbi:MAG: hypothetical protein HZA54_20170, partial [Planctomycetes bacterium]|nr:hypothetical protein [Planctomycetota bacterium]
LACAATAAAGHLVLFGRPTFPPAEATLLWVWLALPAAAVGVADAFAPRPLRWALRPVLAALAAAAVLHFLIGPGRRFAGWGAALPEVAGGATATLASWVGVEAWSARRPRGVALPLLLLAVASVAAAALAFSGSVVLGQLAGVLAAAAGAALVAGLLRPPAVAHLACALPVLLPLLAVLVLSGHFYSDLPMASALLLAAAPLGAWAGDLPACARRGAAWSRAAAALALLFPLAAALALAWPAA